MTKQEVEEFIKNTEQNTSYVFYRDMYLLIQKAKIIFGIKS